VVDRETKGKIDSLLYALRAWDPGEPPESVDDLAKRFQLDPLVVQRICEAEGLSWPDGVPDAIEGDVTRPIASDIERTQPISIKTLK
jgi:hypothetical protein